MNTQLRALDSVSFAKISATDNGVAWSCQPLARDVSQRIRSPRDSSRHVDKRSAAAVARFCNAGNSSLRSRCASISVSQHAGVFDQPVGARQQIPGARQSIAARCLPVPASKPNRTARAAMPTACAASSGALASLAVRRCSSSASQANSVNCSMLVDSPKRPSPTSGRVRLVNNDRVAGGQQLADTIVLERDICKQQVVIDHDYVGKQRLLARLRDKNILVVPTRYPGSCPAWR